MVVIDENMNHGYNHTLQINFQEDFEQYENHLGINQRSANLLPNIKELN